MYIPSRRKTTAIQRETSQARVSGVLFLPGRGFPRHHFAATGQPPRGKRFRVVRETLHSQGETILPISFSAPLVHLHAKRVSAPREQEARVRYGVVVGKGIGLSPVVQVALGGHNRTREASASHLFTRKANTEEARKGGTVSERAKKGKERGREERRGIAKKARSAFPHGGPCVRNPTNSSR